jgi:hypothetical protein
MNVTPFPRFIKSAPQPLGLYFRAGPNDHTTLSQLLAQGQRSYYGIVFDATRVKRHDELLNEAEKARLECILDPCTQASATVGGYSEKHAKLPWGLERPHTYQDFEGKPQTATLTKLAEFAVEHRFSQVFAPTHYVRNAEDRWLEIDAECVYRLREILDRVGGKDIEIIYSLCLPYATFRDESERAFIVAGLKGLPIQSTWLRIDGCGLDGNPTMLRNYIAACRDFNELGLPVVADQMGGLPGLSLLAFSAAGGLATGLGVSERFSANHWHKPKEGKGFMPHPGVYLASLDLSLPRKEAEALFSQNVRLKGMFGCKDLDCCGRGVVDMVGRPAQHFAVQKIKQVAQLSQHPDSLRGDMFLERYVRPTTDLALQLSKVSGLTEALQSKLEKHRHRLDGLRVMLGKLSESDKAASTAQIPKTRSMREGERRPGHLF